MFTLRTFVISVVATSSLYFISASSIADENTSNISIAQVNDAKVFANYTSELPAVVNYFTQLSEQEIISFYQENYGQESSSEMKRGRLSLQFSVNGKTLTVIISPQGKMRQVDLMLR